MTDQSRGYRSVNFDISAKVVQQLGEELVSDEITALLELIKNAYDADATYVSVKIDTEHFLDEPDLYYGIFDPEQTEEPSRNTKVSSSTDASQTPEPLSEEAKKPKTGFITLEVGREIGLTMCFVSCSLAVR